MAIKLKQSSAVCFYTQLITQIDKTQFEERYHLIYPQHFRSIV